MSSKKNKRRMYLALMNAAELIRGHAETGLAPDDVGEESETGLYSYVKACEKASKRIETLAKRYLR